MNSSLNPRSPRHPLELHATLAIFDVDDEPFPSSVTSVFGQAINLIKNNGQWEERIFIEHIGYHCWSLNWSKPFHDNPIIEWSFRHWVIERIQTRIKHKQCIEVSQLLPTLILDLENRTSWSESIFSWAIASCQKAATTKNFEAVLGVQAFYVWGVDEGIPFFNDHLADNICRVSCSPSHAYHLVSLRDPIGGPYSLQELSSIKQALDNRPDVEIEIALFHLCREWGLRPIQLALLRENDVGTDDLGHYVDVPSVKGQLRSKMRRNASNFRRRYITSETNDAIKNLIRRNEEPLSGIISWIEGLGVSTAKPITMLPRPLFPCQRTVERVTRFLKDSSIFEYALHSDSIQISRKFSKLTALLRLTSQPHHSSVASTFELPPLEITCYRFRRTLGTSLVMNGATPQEVADALDHESIDSISHYFKLNIALIDYVNAATERSAEINAAATLWGAKLSSAGPHSASDRPVKDLGICTRGDICPHHPTVSCYSCHSFRPSLDGDHHKAREHIVMFSSTVSSNSTGGIKKQLNDSLLGVNAVIKAIEALKP